MYKMQVKRTAGLYRFAVAGFVPGRGLSQDGYARGTVRKWGKGRRSAKKWEECEEMSSVICILLWLGILAGLDLYSRQVPMWMLAVSGLVMTAVSVYRAIEGERRGVEWLWCMLPGLVLLAATLLSRKVGWADSIVLLLLGMMTDFRACAYSFVFSMLAISLVSLVLLAFRRVKGNTKLPYLPFLWAGYLAQAAMGLASDAL